MNMENKPIQKCNLNLQRNVLILIEEKERLSWNGQKDWCIFSAFLNNEFILAEVFNFSINENLLSLLVFF